MQNMACKILINIVDFINKKSEKEALFSGRDLMMRMLEVCSEQILINQQIFVEIKEPRRLLSFYKCFL